MNRNSPTDGSEDILRGARCFKHALRPIAIFVIIILVLSAFAKESIASGGWLKQIPPGVANVTFARSHPIFYVREPISFKVSGPAATYQIRNYYGKIVDQGNVESVTVLKRLPPGWYKIYTQMNAGGSKPGSAGVSPAPIQDTAAQPAIVGGPSFIVIRRTTGFPALPVQGAPHGSYWNMDSPVRGLTGMGPARLYVRDAAKPEESIKLLRSDIDIDKQFYLPFDPVRKRSLMVAFSNGTSGKLPGVTAAVSAVQGDVKYFEPRNEPNGGSSGANFASKEMKPFFDTVKGVNPALKVLGPGTVSIGPSLLPWIEDFLKAGGAKSIDAFSFHAYNAVNGDLTLGRKSLGSLNALLAKYGADRLEKWQTEQGVFAAMYGVYAPRHQGRWHMLQMMLFEQYGIPKEHNVYFYDKSHGFWDLPTWWENDDSGINPAAVLMRVWSEELYGTKFSTAYDFAEPGNKLYMGSLFAGPGKQVACFMSNGLTDGHVDLKVTGNSVLHTVSAFGEEAVLAVKNGRAILPVAELPVYVELEKGQTIEVLPTAWGANLARNPGAQASSLLRTGSQDWTKDLPKINNGELENWYWAQKAGTGPLTIPAPEFPFPIQLQFPRLTTLSRVVVYASPPWQSQGSLLNYELQYQKGSQWITVDQVNEPTVSFPVVTPATKTTVDTYYSDRWIFEHHFKPVQTNGIRLLIHDSTYGGAATQEVYQAGGQASPQSIVIREIEAYAR